MALNTSLDTSQLSESDIGWLAAGATPDDLYKINHPNYIDSPERYYLIPIVVILLTATYVVVPLRLYTRIKILKSAGIDDWLIIPSVLAVTIFSTISLLQQNVSHGRHMYDIPVERLEAYYKWSFFNILTYTYAIGFPKLSALMFFRRFANEKWFTWCIWVMFTYVIVWMLAFTIIDLLACTPIEYEWKLGVEGHCWSYIITDKLIQIHAYTNLISDIVILCLPMPTVFTMRLPMKQKLILIGIFCLGSLTVVAAILRIFFYYEGRSTSWDLSWSAYKTMVCQNIEVHVAVFCTSAPVLKPLFVKAKEALLSRKSQFSKEQSSETKHWPRSEEDVVKGKDGLYFATIQHE